MIQRAEMRSVLYNPYCSKFDLALSAGGATIWICPMDHLLCLGYIAHRISNDGEVVPRPGFILKKSLKNGFEK